MIILIDKNSVLTIKLTDKAGFEPVLYTLDELKDMPFQVAVDTHSNVRPEGYTEKMTPLYGGYRIYENKKSRVVSREVAGKLVKGLE